MTSQMSVEQETACGIRYIIPDQNAPMSTKALRAMLKVCRVEVVDAKVSVEDSYDSYKTASGFSTY